ncbi:shikimate dehydrogenase [Paramaledivibacter caminithermalis]|jgi:shikimate dehydrogenase|uniref:Shikimate dehydrogenase (NADP(+)) n=1 Tax=Paramaledivibacter caminithermalis (strain DSM 15212 / CIP 107654 / DViRD3) TaxID=1121301 RepID=A0A1M6PL52_PARC5|nr:shikimate dehydrogenase [Paramaledivibacter caminithermalis]SHK08712.1 shikimate dehydrogenase [Paramaledivibacter caminithermalis DSM 15212]
MGLFGLIGEKLKHSFSPAIHSIIFRELNIEGYYNLFEVKKGDLKDAIYGLKALGIRGVNVTIPYKIDIIKYLDNISDEAERIGAVNTICFRDNKAIGYNTDYFGFGIMLDEFNIDIRGKNSVILGTGGASKSVMQYLLDKGIGDITFASRDISKAKEKFKNHRAISYNDIKSLNKKDIIINCTPCGMYPNVENCPVSKKDISKFHTAIDLIYNPRETLFLKYAKEEGIKTVNGLYMLVGQAVKAQELWNDIKISSGAIDRIYDRIREGDRKKVKI